MLRRFVISRIPPSLIKPPTNATPAQLPPPPAVEPTPPPMPPANAPAGAMSNVATGFHDEYVLGLDFIDQPGTGEPAKAVPRWGSAELTAPRLFDSRREVEAFIAAHALDAGNTFVEVVWA